MLTMTADATFVEEFADHEAADSEQSVMYMDRCRKVAVGPSVSLVFENSQTLAFRVSEVQRLRHAYPAATIQRMLGFYSSLMPSPDRLCAAVSVRRPGRRPTAGLNGLGDAIADGTITLCIGDVDVIGEIMPTRASDRTLGPAFWVTFRFDIMTRDALRNLRDDCVISVSAEGYGWESDPLNSDVRRSLCEDLSRRF